MQVALAKATEAITAPTALPGRTRYEMKWDGFRIAVVRTEDHTALWSRQGSRLDNQFPDLLAAAADQLPPGVVLDGEGVIWSADRLDFSVLLSRMSSPATSARRLASQQPASFVAFDVLAVAGHDVRDQSFAQRRALLEELAQSMRPPLQLSPITDDIEVARAWFTDMTSAGIEGLIAKGAAQPYRPGRRDWLKVKHRHTREVVCGAVTGSLSQPQTLVAGLKVGGRLRIVGRTTPLRPEQRRALAPLLRSPTGTHPWPAEVPPSAIDRFTKDRSPVHLVLVDPIVIEVSADTAWSGSSFRHALRFIRPRPEVQPGDVHP